MHFYCLEVKVKFLWACKIECRNKSFMYTNLKYLCQCNMTRAMVLTVKKLCIEKKNIYSTWYKKMATRSLICHRRKPKIHPKVPNLRCENGKQVKMMHCVTRKLKWKTNCLSLFTLTMMLLTTWFPTFLEKGVDIFFWLEVQWRMHIWDS